MRRYLVGLALLAIVAGACAPESSSTSAAQPSGSETTAMTPAECAEAQSSALFDQGASEPQLTALDGSESDSQLAMGGAETGIAPPYANDLEALAPSDDSSADSRVASAD